MGRVKKYAAGSKNRRSKILNNKNGRNDDEDMADG